MKTKEIQIIQTSITSTLDAVGIIDKYYNNLQFPVELRQKENFMADEFQSAKDFMANYFGITPQQAAFLTAIFILTSDADSDFENSNEANFRQIARKLNSSTSEMFRYIKDFDGLIELGILSTNDEINKTRQSLKLSTHVFEAILLNTPYIQERNREFSLGLSDYLKKQKDHIIKCSRRSFPAYRLLEFAEENYNKLGEQFPLMKYINELSISTPEKILFFETCGSTTFQDGKIKVLELAEILFNNMTLKKQFLRNLSTGGSLLVKEDLLDIESGEFLSDLEVTLSEKALEMYLGEEVELYSRKKRDTNVIEAEDIIPRQLYFSGESEEDLSEFESMLTPENFPVLQKKLKDGGMSVGLTTMLYGGPGTGKTESVMQIARKTKRKIVRVDIAAVKSMWLGESEKLIKKVFVNYNALVKREKICPILFFNEADAIFLKRKTGDLRGAENALNAMQNIILEEMENFRGILIATTNLVRNLDPAFERRFLFKIKLSNPSPEVKQRIWADRLPRFQESEFEEIAQKFDFSGGEIDNIVRKLTMSEIIEGTIPTLPGLERLCQQEKFNRNTRRPIGFKYLEQ